MKKLHKGLFYFLCATILLTFTFCNFSSASSDSSKAKSSQMFFIATVNKATIKPLGKEAYQIAFHKIKHITFVSPNKVRGNMSMERFAAELWNDTTKLNATVTAIFTVGDTRKTYLFEVSNPKYNIVTHDFTVNAISFGGKALSAFKSEREIKISDVAFRLDGLKANAATDKLTAEATGIEEKDEVFGDGFIVDGSWCRGDSC